MSPASTPQSVFRRYRAAFVAGILTFCLIFGGGFAWAYWTSSVQGTGNVTTTAVTVQVAANADLNDLFINTHTSLTQTGSFTVTNPSSNGAPGDVSATLSGTGSASGFPVQIWQVANAAACTASTTVPSGTTTGTWGSATAPAVTGVAAGATVTYCVRTVVDPYNGRNAIATASGNSSVTATITGTLATSGWSPKTASSSATLSTQAIFQLATNWQDPTKSRWYILRSLTNNGICLDVSGTGIAAGSDAISWSCSGSRNQTWQLTPIDASGNLVTIQPLHVPSMNLGVYTDGMQSLVTPNANDQSQRWYVQARPNSAYQFVNAATGKCLVLKSSQDGTPVAPVDCNSATVGVAVTLSRLPISFSSPTAGSITISGPASGMIPSNFKLESQPSGGGAWTQRGLISNSNPFSFTFSTSLMANGTYNLRITDGAGNLIHTMTFTKTSTGNTAGLGFG